MRLSLCPSFLSAVIPCLHSFCWTCIQQWFDSHTKCPRCVQPAQMAKSNATLNNLIEAMQRADPSLMKPAEQVSPAEIARTFSLYELLIANAANLCSSKPQPLPTPFATLQSPPLGQLEIFVSSSVLAAEQRAIREYQNKTHSNGTVRRETIAHRSFMRFLSSSRKCAQMADLTLWHYSLFADSHRTCPPSRRSRR